VEKRKKLTIKIDMLKSIGKQSGESGESVPEKNKKATDMRKRKVLSLE